MVRPRPGLVSLLLLLTICPFHVNCQPEEPQVDWPDIPHYTRVRNSYCSSRLGEEMLEVDCNHALSQMPTSGVSVYYRPRARARPEDVDTPKDYHDVSDKCFIKLDVNGTGQWSYVNSPQRVRGFAQEVINDCVSLHNTGGFQVDWMPAVIFEIAHRGLFDGHGNPRLDDTMIVSVTGPHRRRAGLTKAFLTLIIALLEKYDENPYNPEARPGFQDTMQTLRSLEDHYVNGKSWIDQLSTTVHSSTAMANTAPPILANAKVDCLPKFGQPQKGDFPSIESLLLQELPSTISPKEPLVITDGDMTARIETSDSSITLVNTVMIAAALTYLNQQCSRGGILASNHIELKRRDAGVANNSSFNITNINQTNIDAAVEAIDSIVLPANLTLSIYQPGSWEPSS